MARNEEKAMAMLNRWVRMKRELSAKPKDKRPTNPLETDNVPLCVKWRNDVINDIVKKVSDIQNAALGEHKIRELNDDINRLLQEKGRWEDRIKELGGPDYRVIAPVLLDAEAAELPNSNGYKYFGAAKLLPKVRELFQKEVPQAPKVSRKLLYKNISAEYYGMLPEGEEHALMSAEEKAEKEAREGEVEKWKKENGDLRKKRKVEGESEAKDKDKPELTEEGKELEQLRMMHKAAAFSNRNAMKASEEEIKKIILERKKKALLDVYASTELQEKEKETKDLHPETQG